MIMSKVSDEQRRQMIAEAAYFRAERRGMKGGDPVADWIEAEAEVDERLRQVDQSHLLSCLDEGIAAATKKVSSLKRKASTVAVGARAGLQRDVDQLVQLREVLRGKAEELRAQGTRVGELAFHQAERAWHELTDAMRRLGTPTSH
jgi:hypothetical protein